MKRRSAALLLAGAVLMLSGCGNMFEKEYVSTVDYVPAAQEQPSAGERITVRNYSALRSAIRSIVYAGSEQGLITFDQNYDGDSREDMANACAQMRTQDALFAYCVQDISYEYSTIVAHDEAVLHVRYAESAVGVDQIKRMTYATGLDKILRQAMEDNQSRVVFLINVSSYSTLQMKQLVSDTYHASPICAVREPDTDVHMFSGSGNQRLYEIDLDYGLPEDEIIRRKAQLMNLDVRSNIGAEDLDDAHSALAACEYLLENCSLTDRADANTVYDALFTGEANSEGLALAFVEMCHQMDFDCQIVYGQQAWEDHCWNILSLDGKHYHIDISACAKNGMSRGFLRNDSELWNVELYRWNTAAYPTCDGVLRYEDLVYTPEDDIDPEEQPMPGPDDSIPESEVEVEP